jgi:hypothetical protein
MSIKKCINKNSQEWKDLVNKFNGNEVLAEEEWYREGFGDRDDLNYYPEADEADVVTEADRAKTSVEDLLDDVVLNLESKLAVLQRKKVKNYERTKNEIKRLLEQIRDAKGVQAINLFVDDVYDKAEVAEKKFREFVKSINQQSGKAAIDELIAFYDFANRYELLDEISKQDVFEHFTSDKSPEEQAAEGIRSPQQKLTYAISVRNQIRQQVSQYGIPLIADWLMGYASEARQNLGEEVQALEKDIARVEASTKVSDKAKEKELTRLKDRLAKVKSFNVTKESLVRYLREISEDMTGFEYLTGALSSAADPVLSIFAKAVKTEMDTARVKNIQLEQEAAKVFEEYLASVGGNRDNPAEFNKGLYETIRIPKRDAVGRVIRINGEIQYEERVSFVQKYDMSKYFAERQNLPQAFVLSDDPTRNELEAYRQRQRERREWFRTNTQPKSASEIQQILNEKQRELNARIITQAEYDKWYDSVVYTDPVSGNPVYMGELTEPSNKFLNTAWLELYTEDGKPKNAKGKYHKWLTDTYLEQQEGLPEGQKPGLLLPSIYKTNGERMFDNLGRAIKTGIQEKFNFMEGDTQFGPATIAGTKEKFIPVHYTWSIKPEDVSLNLMRSVLMFSSMANNFKALNDIHSEVILYRKIIGERDIAEVNAQGDPLLNPLAKKLGIERYITKEGETYSAKRINDFIDMIVYGEMDMRESVIGLSATKLTGTLIGFSALTTIAADLMKGIANNLQGNIQVIIEAASSEYFSLKNLTRGKSYYMKSIPGFLGDFGKFTAESLGGKLFDLYDPMQGDYMDQYGRMVTASVANKLFRVDTLFFNQHFGEHEIQVSNLFAMLDANKVIDNETGEEISVLDAYEKYGTEEIYNKTDFTDKKRQNIMNTLHALNKRMHGIYNDFDKATAQRYSLGKLAFMYRKYLVPAYKRRFKNLGYDEELGGQTEGYYRTFWNLYLKNLVTLKTDLIKNWADMSPFERAQVKRVIAEATLIIALAALVMVLKAMVDDDDDDLKKNWAYNFVLYEAIRMRSETSQYVPIYGIRDAYRTVKSPSAATVSIDRALKFVDQFFIQSWDPEKAVYQRRTGVWEKGDNKSWAYFLRVMGITGYTLSPEEAIKSFEGALAK